MKIWIKATRHYSHREYTINGNLTVKKGIFHNTTSFNQFLQTNQFLYMEARLTRGSGLCGSPVDVVACQWWEERASTWSGWSTQRDASASQSVGVARHDAAHDLSLSLSLVKLTIFSAIAPLLTFAQLSESLPCLGKKLILNL